MFWRRGQTDARDHGAAGSDVLDKRWGDLSRTLAESPCWSHLPPATAAECQGVVAAGGYPFTGDVFPGVDFITDGEELAEGGVEDLLQLMDPALSDHGVALRVEVSRLAKSIDDDYVLHINGRRCLVLDRDDWIYGRPWYDATVRPLAVVNDLLVEAGASARVFTLYTGGNEGAALLLDPQVIAAVARSGLIDAEDLPVLVIDDTRL